jgi:hypothetical protein
MAFILKPAMRTSGKSAAAGWRRAARSAYSNVSDRTSIANAD